MEIGEGELLVGTMQIVVVLAPAQEQGIDAQMLLDEPDNRNRAPLANENRPRTKAGLDGADRSLDARRFRIDDDGRRTVMTDDLISHTRRTNLRDMFVELPLDRLGVLVGHQPETELGTPLARQYGLGARTGITAEDPVDIAGGPGPLPFERGITGFTLQGGDAEIGLKLGLREGQLGELSPLPVFERLDRIVKAGNLDLAVRALSSWRGS